MDKLLAKGRAVEVSDIQATGLEEALSSAQILEESINFKITRRKLHQFTRKRSNSTNASNSNICHNCGGMWPHKTTPCQARGKECRNFRKLDHFVKHCRGTNISKEPATVKAKQQQCHRVHNVENLPSSNTDAEKYLFTVRSEERETRKTRIKINIVSVDMVVDIGASINIMDEPNFAALQQSVHIQLQ